MYIYIYIFIILTSTKIFLENVIHFDSINITEHFKYYTLIFNKMQTCCLKCEAAIAFGKLAQYATQSVQLLSDFLSSHFHFNKLSPERIQVLVSTSWGSAVMILMARDKIPFHNISTPIAQARLSEKKMTSLHLCQTLVRFSSLQQSYLQIYIAIEQCPRLFEPLFEFILFMSFNPAGTIQTAELNAYWRSVWTLYSSLDESGKRGIYNVLSELAANVKSVLSEVLFLQSSPPLQFFNPPVSRPQTQVTIVKDPITANRSPKKSLNARSKHTSVRLRTHDKRFECTTCNKLYKYEATYKKHRAKQCTPKLWHPWE